MDSFVCRGCGADAEEIANIVPTVRQVTSIALVDGSLTASLNDSVEIEDAPDGFVWQCQSCGHDGYTLEQVLEVDAA